MCRVQLCSGILSHWITIHSVNRAVVLMQGCSDPEVCGRSEDDGFALKPSSMSVPLLPQTGPAWPGHRPPLGMAMAAPQAKDQQD
ncbi:unnamed protein product [Boreogadus saida]